MSFRASALRWFGLLLPCLIGCNEQTVEVELHSLQASEDVAFVCRTDKGTGVDRSQCPDFENLDYAFYALVTQASTEEVAVINVSAAKVVDLDPSAPGYSFLRVPSKPGDIVSTPGGTATFVGITSPGKTGITGIPTTCITAPSKNQSQRDLTSFPSCHLPTAPGEMAVLVEPPDDDGTVHSSCLDGRPVQDGLPIGGNPDFTECTADTTREHLDVNENVVGPVGRRKLAVALPDFGEVAIIDAQWLLDQPPGSFSECRVEATLPLEVNRGPAGTKQRVPEELVPKADCVIEQPIEPPVEPNPAPRPAGLAPAGNRLYVGDENAPVIHVLDVSNPCAPAELAPLLPMSIERPDREVVTARLAASPLTPDNKRYVYAIDKYDQPSSVMMFDVSPDSTDRTPLVRPGSLRIPEPADRLKLGSPIADIAFALRDLPAADPDTGVAQSGVRCDPSYLTASPDSPAAQHRPTSDETRGAQPRLLRGLFGLAMLTTGYIAIIDVDDFDAPCRRPYTTNDTTTEDFRGCLGDPPLPDLLTLDGTPNTAVTVTNEVSCNMVEPHRFRSGNLGVNSADNGVGAPALAGFPDFDRLDDATSVPATHLPKLLAVPFENPDEDLPPLEPEVYVGTTLYKVDNANANLVTDPNTATLSSLTLPFVEPRSMPGGDNWSVVYEGAITRDLTNGNFVLGDTSLDEDDPNFDDRIEDGAANFCSRGVYDIDMLEDLGAKEFHKKEGPELDAFVNAHQDVVEITTDLLSSDNDYWSDGRLTGLACGLTYEACVDTFDSYDELDVPASREFVVREAYQSRLVVDPKNATTPEERAALSKALACCFPQGIQYRIRAQKQWVVSGVVNGIDNDVAAIREGNLYRCHRACDPKKSFSNSRVFEVASSQSCIDATGAERCTVGQAEEGDPCVYRACDPAMNTPVGACARADATLDVSGSEKGAAACIYEDLSSRFVIYRGLQPSVRGMKFFWQTNGGFRPLVTSLSTASPAVLPRRVDYVPELESIAIVDGAQVGLTMVSLDTLRVEDPWPVY